MQKSKKEISLINNFEFYSPTCFVFGKDTESKAGSLIRRFGGSKVLIHYGGGSVIDSAKAIAAGTVYEGDFWDFYSGKLIEKALPVGTVSIPDPGVTEPGILKNLSDDALTVANIISQILTKYYQDSI